MGTPLLLEWLRMGWWQGCLGQLRVTVPAPGKPEPAGLALGSSHSLWLVSKGSDKPSQGQAAPFHGPELPGRLSAPGLSAGSRAWAVLEWGRALGEENVLELCATSLSQELMADVVVKMFRIFRQPLIKMLCM